MLRKLILFVAVSSLALGSCGHQVTPDRSTGPGGLSTGQIQIKFNTVGSLDFTNFWYVLAINTGQNPSQVGEPYALFANQQQNWRNLDWQIIISGQSGVPAATIIPFVNQIGGNGQPIKVPLLPIIYSPQSVVVNPNCNGTGTQFCVTLDRSVLAPPPGSGSPSPSPTASSPLPCTSGSPSPAPTGTATASPSPSPSPTGSPTAAPSGSPSPSGGCLWYVNWWVSQAGTLNSPVSTSTMYDVPGLQNVQDQTFSFTIDTTTTDGCTASVGANGCLWTALPPGTWPAVANSAGQIAGGQVINSP